MGNYVKLARQTAKKYKIPTSLFLSMINQESGWKPDAISSVGAIGLGQLMPGTAQTLGVNPTDPAENLDGAARHLATMFRKTGTWPNALRAYNMGLAGSQTSPQAGAEYARSVIAGRKKYAALAPLKQPAALGAKRFGHLKPAGGKDWRALSGLIFENDPVMKGLFDQVVDKNQIVDVPDEVVQKSGTVSPGGSVKRVPLPSGEVGSIIGAAQTQLGKPYVFGSGPDTSSFDCSDLIQWAYKQYGFNLPRTTFEQIHVGQPVEWKNLSPGDLIFPTTHHVVMYVGNGKVIAAPHTGTVVQYQDVNRFANPVAIRRVVT